MPAGDVADRISRCGSAVLAAGFPSLGIGFLGVSLAFGLTVLTMATAICPRRRHEGLDTQEGPFSGANRKHSLNPSFTGFDPKRSSVSNPLIAIDGRISVWGYAGSFRLQARELDDIRPLLGFVGDQLPEVSIRERKYRDAHISKPSLDLRVSE
jgi:hypothetical protein